MEQKEIETAAAEAEALELAVRAEPDRGVYVHNFRKPFQYQGAEHAQLRFDFGSMTGADYLAVENDMIRHGKTLVSPEFSGDFLCGMAVRCCLDRNENGMRVVSAEAMRAMPIRDFIAICKEARNFLLRAGRKPTTGFGSGSSV